MPGKNRSSIVGNDTDEAQVIIQVQDDIDPPVFSQTEYLISVQEEIPPGNNIIIFVWLFSSPGAKTASCSTSSRMDRSVERSVPTSRWSSVLTSRPVSRSLGWGRTRTTTSQ